MTSWMSLKSLPPLKWDEPYPLFNRISLETVGRCTRECVFCPSRMRTSKQRGTMSDEVFDTLMSQFSDLGFNGVMQLFYLGEPLLDKKIVERIRKARVACPKAKLLLTSNGDLLKTSEQIDELFTSGLNLLNIDCYDTNTYKKIENIVSNVDIDIDVEFGNVQWRSSHNSKTVIVADVSRPSITRANHYHSYLISEFETKLRELNLLAKKKAKFCAMPHRRLVVWWTGDVVLCCVTTPVMKNPVIVGSYRDVLKAWNSKEMQKYRWQLQQGLKKGSCKNCYHSHAYPHVVRRITKPDFID